MNRIRTLWVSLYEDFNLQNNRGVVLVSKNLTQSHKAPSLRRQKNKDLAITLCDSAHRAQPHKRREAL